MLLVVAHTLFRDDIISDVLCREGEVVRLEPQKSMPQIVVPDKAIVVVFTDLISITSANLVASQALVMPGPTPHRTPLRRVSQGSLFALSRSGAHSDAPHGLGFLEPALAELADEAEALRANVDGLRALSASLDTFNESFASWLYVMNMNALTVEWPEVSIRSFLFFCISFFLSF